MGITDIVCIFYVIPTLLLMLYIVLQEVVAERSGRPRASRPDLYVSCVIPGLNLLVLWALLLLLYLRLCGYVCEKLGRKGPRT